MTVTVKLVKCFAIAFFMHIFSACGVLKSAEKVEKSTTEVGEKVEKTNDGVEKTNDGLKQANQKIDETNGNLTQTNKKVDETKTQIEQTNQKMDDVRQQLDDANAKLSDSNKRIEQMNESLERLYQNLRQGDALNARLNLLKTVLDTPQLKGKITPAGRYFMSFEYQLWSADGTDDNVFRKILARLAVDEFFKEVQRLSRSDLPLNLQSQDNTLQSLEALALALHTVNANSELILMKKNISLESMHTLIKNSLTMGFLFESGKITAAEIPEFAQVALKHSNLAAYLLELRVSLFPALVISMLSDANSDNFCLRWFARVSNWVAPWTARTNQLNVFQLEEYTQWMAWAKEDVQFLKGIGKKARVDQSLLQSMRNLRLKNPEEIRDNSSAAKIRQQAQSNLQRELQSYLQSINEANCSPEC